MGSLQTISFSSVKWIAEHIELAFSQTLVRSSCLEIIKLSSINLFPKKIFGYRIKTILRSRNCIMISENCTEMEDPIGMPLTFLYEILSKAKPLKLNRNVQVQYR